MQLFYWLEEGRLAGSSCPGACPDATPDQLAADLAAIRQAGIEALASLTETPPDPGTIAGAGMTHAHFPIADETAPGIDLLAEAVSWIAGELGAGRPVLVHCLAGEGRTGTVLAAWLVRGGQSAAEAIAQVRRVCPGAVETAEQERVLAELAVWYQETFP